MFPSSYPVTFSLAGGQLEAIGPSADGEARLQLRDDVLYMVNPGAVGQPRDGDPRAAYAIVDVTSRQVDLFRLDYPIEAAQAKIVDAGLPPRACQAPVGGTVESVIGHASTPF